MKRFILLLLLMLPCLPNRIMAEAEQRPYPLGCFDFDFKRLAAAESMAWKSTGTEGAGGVIAGEFAVLDKLQAQIGKYVLDPKNG